MQQVVMHMRARTCVVFLVMVVSFFTDVRALATAPAIQLLQQGMRCSSALPIRRTIAANGSRQMQADAKRMVSEPTQKEWVWCSVPDSSLHEVMTHGLLTYATSLKAGLPVKLPQVTFPDDLNVLRFAYHNYRPEATCEQKWVGVAVDPGRTYVYNSAFRRDQNYAAYQRSKVLLATYLKNLKKTWRWRQDEEERADFLWHRRWLFLDGAHADCQKMHSCDSWRRKIIFDPFTAEPFCVNATDARVKDDANDIGATDGGSIRLTPLHYEFPNEVLVDGDVSSGDCTFLVRPPEKHYSAITAERRRLNIF